MKKLLLVSFVVMSFACSERVAICNKIASCDDDFSEADQDDCIEDAEERDQKIANFDDPDCDDLARKDQEYVSCLNSNGECNDGEFGTTQCDDEFRDLAEEELRTLFEDCDG